MTATTPEQMRALADQVKNYWPPRAEIQAALRAAADQLEAVRRWNHRDGYHLADRELDAILAGDTAPLDPAPAKRMLLTHPHDGHGPDDTCRNCEVDR